MDSINTNERKWTLIVPGRVNLIGEHTDYNGGLVLPFGIDKSLYFSCTEVDSNKPFFSISSQGQEESFIWEWNQLSKEAPSAQRMDRQLSDSWGLWPYAALAKIIAYVDHSKMTPNSSLSVQLSSTLPSGGGVSSSAALSTGLLSLLARWLNIDLCLNKICVLAMEMEHEFAGTKCGLMDQLAVTQTQAKKLMMIDFADFPNEQKWSVKHVTPHSKLDHYLPVSFNTQVKHSLADSPYNQRRKSCEDLLQHLNKSFDTNKGSLGEISSQLSQLWPHIESQEELKNHLANEVPSIQAKRGAHAIFENIRVAKAVAAIESGDLPTLDQMMIESHQSLRDDYEVSCPELDFACEMMRSMCQEIDQQNPSSSEPAILGPRMTGGGFGGSTIQLIRKDIIPKLQAALQNDNPYFEKFGKTGDLSVTSFSSGLSFNA